MENAGTKRLSRVIIVIVMAVIVLGCLARGAYEFFFRERGMDYYKETPYMLFVPLGIAFIVGLGAWVLSRLARETARRVKMWLWGSLNVVGVLAVGWFSYMAYDVFQFERSETGKIITGVDGEFLLGYTSQVFMLSAVILLAILVFSWWRLARAVVSLREIPQEEDDQDEAPATPQA